MFVKRKRVSNLGRLHSLKINLDLVIIIFNNLWSHICL